MTGPLLLAGLRSIYGTEFNIDCQCYAPRVLKFPRKAKSTLAIRSHESDAFHSFYLEHVFRRLKGAHFGDQNINLAIGAVRKFNMGAGGLRNQGSESLLWEAASYNSESFCDNSRALLGRY